MKLVWLCGWSKLTQFFVTGRKSLVITVVVFKLIRSFYCKVTGRRHRVSPCRSAYFASPWWLLNLDRRRRSRESAVLFPESWWHPTMRGSRASLFMIVPNTKRHPNNTKTDQLPISEVITGLPRPYHNNSPTNPHSHPATTQGFFADTHRLTVKAILRLILEHRTNERIANAVA